MIGIPTIVFAAGDDQQKAAPLGLFVLVLLGVACYFLFKSMSRHLKRVRDDFPAESPPGRSGVGPRAGTGGVGTSGVGTGPVGTGPVGISGAGISGVGISGVGISAAGARVVGSAAAGPVAGEVRTPTDAAGGTTAPRSEPGSDVADDACEPGNGHPR